MFPKLNFFLYREVLSVDTLHTEFWLADKESMATTTSFLESLQQL